MRGVPAFLSITGFELDQHAHCGRQVGGALVQVGLDIAVEVLHPAQFQLLADFGRQLGDGLLDRPVTDLGGLEGVDVGGLGDEGCVNDLFGKFAELSVFGDEVGLGIELDHRATLGGHQPLGSGPLGTLADILGTLDPQCLDSLVEVATVGGECVLAVQHSRAGELAEPFYVGGGVVSHLSPL